MRHLRLAVLALCILLGGLTLCEGAARAQPTSNATAGPDRKSSLPRDQRLSNEQTFTRWAHIARIASIYSRPTTSASRVATLHWYTESYFPEIYLLLRTHWDRRHREWVQLRIPMRPNGRTGWVLRRDLGRFHLTHALIIVNREQLRMDLFERGRLVWSAPVGVGAPSTPTPAGHFWVTERFVIQDPSSGYWPYAFGTSDYSTLSNWPGGGVVGIHGPYYQASEIPGRISHGCIRLRTGDDAWLGHHLGLGTPVRVL
ncbi:MAG TPA: L,D-transpeptidase [Solirubrobacteraceae bacterium]|nr:L,D-transpeptidase [Solirubrobacteraceae bacterium]